MATTSTDVASRIRQAGRDVRKSLLQASGGGDRTSSDGIYDILTYIESDWGLGMNLFPAQRVIIKLYYFLELDTKLPEEEHKRIKIRDLMTGKLKFVLTEREFLTYLHNEGKCNIGEQDHERRQLLLAIGRRAGKTTLSSIFASYEIYRLLNLHNPQEYYGLPNGDRIQVISVATDKDQASILFNNVAGHLAKCDYFKPYQANNTQSQVNFRTPYDIEQFGSTYRENGKFSSFNGKASLRLTFKGASGKGLRGAGNIVIILDEFAHFLESGPTSAKEIYKAVTPSAAAFTPKKPENPQEPRDGAMPESRVICISSPLGKSGQFYKLYSEALGKDEGSHNMLAIQAPTWEINPTVPLEYLQQEYHSDPRGFSVEFGAEFNDQVSGWIEREEDLMACVVPTQRPAQNARPKLPHNMGVDIGLTNDGTFLVVTHIEDGKIVLDYHEGWYAGKDWKDTNPHLQGQYSVDYAKTLANVERLDFDEISKWIRVISKRFSIRAGLFDSWNGIPLEQSLHKMGLKQFQSEQFTRDATSKIYQAAKMMIFDEKLVLYDYPIPKTHDKAGGGSLHSPHIAELLHLKAKQISKNVVLVAAPEGSHDDFSDAFVRSVWLSTSQLTNEKHASRGFGVHGPYVAAKTGLVSFQMMRARKHGIGPRAVPKQMSAAQRYRYTR